MISIRFNMRGSELFLVIKLPPLVFGCCETRGFIGFFFCLWRKISKSSFCREMNVSAHLKSQFFFGLRPKIFCCKTRGGGFIAKGGGLLLEIALMLIGNPR